MHTYLRSLALAILAHVLLWAALHYLLLSPPPSETPPPAPPLRVKIIADDYRPNNKAPKDSKVLAAKDHSTVRQVSPSAKMQNKQAHAQASKRLPRAKTLIADPITSKEINYAEFLQRSATAMAGITWQEQEAGDVIDINTSSYRYAGYFTAMRNSITLAWHYPQRAARAGQQGLVKLDFSVDAQGYASAIQIIKSSGYHMLDAAIIAAIRSASPFQPLPTSIGDKEIRIRGSFWYVLND